MSEKIVQLNDEVIKGQSKELVCGSVEETLNELLEKEAESLTQAARYERIIERYRRRESNVSSKPRMNIELRRATMCGNTPKSFSCRSCL